MARREVHRGRGDITLGATTVLHEAYLKIADRQDREFPDQPRFLAYASRVMRRLIVDHAPRRHAHKRGTQSYVCLPASGGVAWRFVGPQATLVYMFNAGVRQQVTRA